MDNKSVGGSLLTIILATFGELTLGEWASIAAIATAAVTISYTVWRWRKESKKK